MSATVKEIKMPRKTKSKKPDVISKLFLHMIHGDEKKKALACRIYNNIISYKHFSDEDLRRRRLSRDKEALWDDPVYQKLAKVSMHLENKYNYNSFAVFAKDNMPFYENGGEIVSEYLHKMEKRELPEALYNFIAESSVEQVVLAIEAEARLEAVARAQRTEQPQDL